MQSAVGNAAPVTDTESAFAELLAAYGAALRRIARGYAGRAGEHEDLHQEILCQLWRSFPRFRGESAAGTWLYRVALNTALSYRRRSFRRPPVGAGPLDEARHPASAGAPVDENAILRDFLDGLDVLDRAVMVLYMEGLSQPAIADVVGLSAGAVAVRVHRMKRAFQQRYVER